ncbi:MAG: type III polyketide synthase [Chlamydiae bacterium]|nr:type III polyketide synthase [Chlamydiota bacterium]MBI3276393.1 type III polyketide synthase [Chlamydiota bacterium]
MSVYLNRIEAVVPPYEGHDESIGFLSKFVASSDQYKKFIAIANRLGIDRRYTVLKHFFSENGIPSEAFYHSNRFPSTQERMERYQKEAFPLAAQAIIPLQTQELSSVTHLIVTSCTGFYAPGVDVDIIQRLGLRTTVHRTFIGYMGCFAAISGLKLARDIVRAQPESKVLMVNLELCTLHWRRDHVPFDQLISFLLFADGCAASLISSEPVGLKLKEFYSVIIPESLSLMRWTIGNDGFFMSLDSQLPSFISQGIRNEKKKILNGFSVNDFNFCAIHPGGRTILEAVQSELDLEDSKMKPSYEILRNYGNMSSPTIMFILRKFLEDSSSKGLGCGMAFGPGLTIESFLFEK